MNDRLEPRIRILLGSSIDASMATGREGLESAGIRIVTLPEMPNLKH